MLKDEIQYLREVAKQYKEYAELPRMQQLREEWKRHNARKPGRPMVMIDQLPYSEMNVDGELDLKTTDPFLQSVEWKLKTAIFQQKHFPVDMVAENFFEIPVPIYGWSFGDLGIVGKTVFDEDGKDVKGQHYEDVLQTEEDADKIHAGTVRADEKAWQHNMSVGHEIFDGILPIRPQLVEMSFQLWDAIVQWHGVDNSIYDLVDRPEFMHKILTKMTDALLDLIDQTERLGYLKEHNQLIHCTGAYTYDEHVTEEGKKTSGMNAWTFGMSQIFSTVSPQMHEEFEVPYLSRLFARFKNVYYGCCEPLHDKVDMIRKYPNVRKISMSPWANKRKGAEAIHGDYVYSAKPSPAFLAYPSFNPDAVRADLVETIGICKENHTNCELILKDISTTRNHPERVFEWAKIATDLVQKEC